MSKKAANAKLLEEVEQEKQELRSFTGWKLDLCRAVRADHKVPPGPASLFAAIMDFVNADTKKAWPSEGGLAIALGTSRPTIRKYLTVLINAKWIKPDGKSKRGTTIYLVQDYRMNAVLDQLVVDMDRFREDEARRQTRRRELRVCKQGFTPIQEVSVNTGSGLSVNTGLYEHLHRTPSSQNSTEKGNTYGRASNGF